MSRTQRGRRQAYDNIAIGSAISTQERVLPDASAAAAGALAAAESQGRDKIAVGGTNPSERPADNYEVGTTTLAGEKVGNQ